MSFVLTVQNRFAGQPHLQKAARAYRAGRWTQEEVDFFNAHRRNLDEIDFCRSIVLVLHEEIERKSFLHSFYKALENQGNAVAWMALIEADDEVREGYSQRYNDLPVLEKIKLGKLLNDQYWNDATKKERDVLAYCIFPIGALFQ